MPNKQEWLDHYRDSYPQLTNVSDKDLWNAVSVDHGFTDDSGNHVPSPTPVVQAGYIASKGIDQLKQVASNNAAIDELGSAVSNATDKFNGAVNNAKTYRSLYQSAMTAGQDEEGIGALWRENAIRNFNKYGQGVEDAGRALTQQKSLANIGDLFKNFASSIGPLSTGAVIPPFLEDIIQKGRQQQNNEAGGV